MKKDWLLISLGFLIAIALISSTYLQYQERNKLPYLSCKAEVNTNFYSFTSKFNQTYDAAINFFAKRSELSEFLPIIGAFTFSTDGEERFFKDNICSAELVDLMKKTRGKLFKYREILVADYSHVSLEKMLDDFQVLHAKLNNIELEKLCCR